MFLLKTKSVYETVLSVSVCRIQKLCCVHSAPFMGQHVSSMLGYKCVRLAAGGSDWMVMPLFLCGCVKAPELLTNAPVTHSFPCDSTLDLALFYSISPGPACTLTERISCACSAIEAH